MVAIRLRRAGSKKRPYFRIVVTDSRAARDSSFVEILGHYNPRTRPALVDVQRERVDYWVSKGAQLSDSVRTLIKRHLTPLMPKVTTTTGAEAIRPTTGAERTKTTTGAETVTTRTGAEEIKPRTGAEEAGAIAETPAAAEAK
ncbi:MAG: 30S ribosomal protein S16 [Vicinamibacterales bacterium]